MVSQGVLFLPTAVTLGSSGGKEERLHAKNSKNEAELNWYLSYLCIFWKLLISIHVAGSKLILPLNKCLWIKRIIKLSVGRREIRCIWDRPVIHKPLSAPKLLSTGSRIAWLMSNDTWDATVRPSEIFFVQLQHGWIKAGGKWSRQCWRQEQIPQV